MLARSSHRQNPHIAVRDNPSRQRFPYCLCEAMTSDDFNVACHGLGSCEVGTGVIDQSRIENKTLAIIKSINLKSRWKGIHPTLRLYAGYHSFSQHFELEHFQGSTIYTCRGFSFCPCPASTPSDVSSPDLTPVSTALCSLVLFSAPPFPFFLNRWASLSAMAGNRNPGGKAVNRVTGMKTILRG